MRKMVLGLMVVAGFLGTSTVAANAADKDPTSKSDVAFSEGKLSMSVDSVPLSFGKSEISAAGATLGASSSPTVTVSDLRGNNAGWSLTVAQGQQFKTNAGDSVLTNAGLKVASDKISGDSTVNTANTSLNPGTTPTMVASASAGHGNGISQFNFGSSTLIVPDEREAPKLAQGYSTTLTWNLTDAPSNPK